MTAKPWNDAEANRELNYILSIDPANPGDNFNNDTECFARYCVMQSNKAINSSKHVVGAAIARHGEGTHG
tara:strand:+ start:288 stop:497 length:210 start_codon:yes stop_codon:yes gene_type:complete